MRALTRAWRAERLATTRTRMASTAPSLDFGLPVARPPRAARAASTASRGSDLPLLPALLAIRSVDLDDFDTRAAQMASQAGPIGTGALDADLGHTAEALEPRQQRFVAGRVGAETLGSEQPAERVQCGCDMHVSMRVDTTGDPTRSFYDGHGHPFLSKV